MKNDGDASRKGKTMPRLLLIEDDIRQGKMLEEFFGSSGVSLFLCVTGADGIAKLKRDDFDALILDIGLSDMDGFEVCRRVRTFSGIPILMLTARGEETDRIIGLELGADDYLPKPFNPRELLARIKAILRRGRVIDENRESVMKFGGLEISPDERVARLQGGRLDLTGFQFDILHALAKTAGRVMSRDALMDELAGHELDGYDRRIDVHISRIRAKIEHDPKQPERILTVRGVGYVFSRVQK